MKRAVFLSLLLIASTAFGNGRTEKRRLVSELLEVMDVKTLLQMSFESFVDTVAYGLGEHEAEVTEERRVLQEQLFLHIDYQRYFDEVYAPVFEEHFTEDELRHLIVFFRTPHGDKLAAILPQLGIGTEPKGFAILQEAMVMMQKEKTAQQPWLQTMSDLQTLGVAVESRATDTNDYPNVSFEQLEALVAPTYIVEVPKIDAWGTPFLYVADGAHYRFVSAGADRRFEWNARYLDLTRSEPQVSEDLDADIILQDGIFIQAPPEQ